MMNTSPSLADRAETTLIRLTAVLTDKKNAEAVSRIENVRQRAKVARENLNALLTALPAMEAAGVARPQLPSAKSKDLAKARQAFKTTASSVAGKEVDDIASRVSTATFDSYLGLAENLYNILLAQLNKAVDARRIELSPDKISEPIVALPGVAYSDILALQRIQRTFQTPVAGLASVSELLKRLKEFETAVEEWAEKRPRLDEATQTQPEQVRRFIAAATSEEGAPWELLTDEVRDWLSIGDHSDSIRIHLRS